MCKRLCFLISFAMLLSAASNVQALTTVTTADGNGADTYLTNDSQQGPTTITSAEVRIRAFRQLADTRSKTGYIRFDLSDVVGDMNGATLTFEATFLKGAAKAVDVYGLIDGDGDSWDESTITYNIAPGMLPATLGNYAFDLTKVTLLGTITTPAAGPAYPARFSSNPTDLPLGDFLNADTNKLVTFVFIGGNNEGEIASKEHPTYLEPTLTLPNALKPPASYPNPADGSMVYSANVNLQWQRGAYAVKHDVYIGTSLDDVNNATTSTPIIYKGRQDPNNYTATDLIPGTTYYWRIDEVRADGTTIDRGEIWSFEFVSQNAWGPTPAGSASFITLKMTLHWNAGSGAVVGHNVYLSDNFDAVNNAPEGSTALPFRAFLAPTADPNWNPAKAGVALGFNKTYYWRIDEVESQTPMNIHKGEVWSFTTVPNAPSEPNLVGWWKLDEDASDSGYGCDGIEIGSPTYDVGSIDGAIFMDNSNNTDPGDDIYVDLPIGSVISTLNSSTFAVWVNWMGTEGDRRWQRIFSFGTDTTNFMVLSPRQSSSAPTYFEITTGGVTELVSWGPYSTVSGFMIIPNEWHHLAVTISDPNEAGTRTFTLYIDGDPCGVNSAATLTPSDLGFTTQNWLGRTENITEQRPYRGYLDDFRIYDRELSQAEIQDILTPQKAWNPSPANRATDVQSNPTLSWMSGRYADKHDVYLGTDFNDVNSADNSTAGIYKGQQSETTFKPGILEFNTTYYWRVDEVNMVDPNLWRGAVWNFTTGNYITVDDFESYNDLGTADPNSNRIYNTWLDYYTNNTGATVGYLWETLPPDEHFAETTIVNSGSQSMPLFYDNDGTVNEGTKFEKTSTYYYSETERTFDPVEDWTRQGVKSLALWFRGYPATEGSYTLNADTFTVVADGAGITGTADEFHFVYKKLTVTADIVARVVSVSNTDEWAKAGVMIRDNLEEDSTHAFMCVTPSGRVSFEARDVYKGDSLQGASNANAINLPYWVRLVRDIGNVFTAYYSTNGTNWEQVPVIDYTGATTENPEGVPMSDPVYIGLAFTSGVSGAFGEAVFSNVQITGNVSGEWQSRDVPSNDAEQLYIAVEDASNNIKVIDHPNPNAVLLDTWTEWPIDLADLSGVNLQAVKMMYISVGDRDNPVSGGFGKLYIDDIRLHRSRCVPSKRKPAGDFNNDCVVDYLDLQIMTNNWLISGDYDVMPVAPGDANLVAHYQFNGDFSDSSNGYHGEPNGASIINDPSRGQVASFDGEDDYVSLHIGSVISSLTNCTFATWVNFSNAGGAWQRIFDFGNDATVYMFLTPRMDTTGPIRFAITTGGGGAAEIRADAADTLPGGWHHVAVTIDADKDAITLYLDGLIVAQNTEVTLSPSDLGVTANNWLGRSQYTADAYYMGSLDDFRIYDRALSQGEIGSLAGKTAVYTQPLDILLSPQDSAIDMNSDGTIDLKDYVKLASMWLEELLWPQP